MRCASPHANRSTCASCLLRRTFDNYGCFQKYSEVSNDIWKTPENSREVVMIFSNYCIYWLPSVFRTWGYDSFLFIWLILFYFIFFYTDCIGGLLWKLFRPGNLIALIINNARVDIMLKFCSLPLCIRIEIRRSATLSLWTESLTPCDMMML